MAGIVWRAGNRCEIGVFSIENDFTFYHILPVRPVLKEIS
jgi:hypothetical protein